MRWIIILAGFSYLFTASFAAAEENASPPTNAFDGGQIEISADESLEWYQDKGLYVARGNARATRGSLTVKADVLTAHERDPIKKEKTGKNENMPEGGNIDLLTAEGNVHISDSRQQVFGERAIYDLDRRIAKITGKNLKYVTDKDTVTARDSLEYYEGKNMAIARGKAIAIHDQRRVEADVMMAHFAPGANGEMEMIDMVAEGNVTVLTGNDISRGDRAVYDVKRNIAVMTGNVRVTRNDIQLSGDRAEVDFNRGESRLVNRGGGRVRALLMPKTEGKTTKKETAVDSGRKTSQKSGTKESSQ